MEIWETTGRDAMDEATATGKVENLGETGMQAIEDWWYPSYMKEKCPGRPDWKALNKCAEAFSTPETAPKGRYLGGPVTWGGFDDERAEALRLLRAVARTVTCADDGQGEGIRPLERAADVDARGRIVNHAERERVVRVGHAEDASVEALGEFDLAVDLDAVCARHGRTADYVADGIAALASLRECGAVEVAGGRVRVKPEARLLLRLACAAFDRRFEPTPHRHARAV